MLLHGRVGLQITVNIQQAVLITACMRVVVLPPDSGYVGAALNKVNELSEVCTPLFIDGLVGLVLPVQPRYFPFERVYLMVE